MPGSFITDDIDTMVQTTEFATSVTYTATGEAAATIDIIFNPEENTVDPYTGEDTTILPMGWAATSDVPNIAHKDVFLINGITYEVLKHFDNHGLTQFFLNKT
jgi:hypothetical protein